MLSQASQGRYEFVEVYNRILRPSLAHKLLHVRSLDTKRVFWSKQSLGKEVGYHITGGDVGESNCFILHFLPNPVIFVLEMLGSGLKEGITSQSNGPLIVTIENGDVRRRIAKVHE